MYRSAHLPPRCPSQNRSPASRLFDPAPQTVQKDSFWHGKFSSLDSVAEKQPYWLDDIFVGSEETNSRGVLLRRSASDPTAFMDAFAAYHPQLSHANEENSTFDQGLSQESVPAGVVSPCRFEGDFVYGPNSPRRSSESMQSENSMVSALLESIPDKPLEFISAEIYDAFNVSEQSGEKVCHRIPDDTSSENAPRRHAGQRSRVRKLQYIAELERTVGVYESMEVDLISKLNSLRHRRVALSVENKKLKWQIINLRKEKMMKDGEVQSLKNEIERLKMMHGRHRRSKSLSYFETGRPDGDALSMDMIKLGLGGGDPYFPLGHSLHG